MKYSQTRSNLDTSNVTIIILLGLVLFHLISNYIWLKIDTTPLIYDAAEHYLYSLRVFKGLKDFWGSATPFPLDILKTGRGHGILVGIVTVPFYFIFGTGQDTAVMVSNTIFFLILIFSVYGIAKELANRKAGVLAAFIVSMYPGIFSQLRVYMLDLPLAAMVALSVYFLMKSDYLRNKGITILFIITFLFGLMIKVNFIIFIAGPLIFIIYKRLINKERQLQNRVSKKSLHRLLPVIFFLLVAIGLTGLFFVLNFSYYFMDRIRGIIGRFMNLLRFCNFSLKDLLVYWVYNFLNFFLLYIRLGISFFFLIIFLLGFYFFHHLKSEKKAYVYFSIIVPVLFIGMLFFPPVDNDAVRYSLPCLSFIAIICTAGIVSIRPKIFKKALIISIIIFGLAQYFIVSYPIDILPEVIQVNLGAKNKKLVPLVLFARGPHIQLTDIKDSSRPTIEDWDFDKIIDFITEHNKLKSDIIVFSLVDNPKVLYALYHADLMQNKSTHMHIFTIDIFQNKWQYIYRRPYEPPLTKLIMNADYVLVGEGGREIDPDNDYYVLGILREAKAFFEENRNSFRLIRTFDYPEGLEVMVYYREPKIAQIKQGPLSLLFKDNCFHLFWEDERLTRDLGLYTSVLLQKKSWHESNIAFWEVVEKDIDFLIVRGHWLHLPITQTWHIKLKPNNVISLDITMDVIREIDIIEEQTNIMLESKYKSWFTVYSDVKGNLIEKEGEILYSKRYKNERSGTGMYKYFTGKILITPRGQ